MKHNMLAHGHKLMHPIFNNAHTRIALAMAFFVTVIFGTIYVGIQQDIRHSGNDPQIQMAEDAARALSSGVSPQLVLPPGIIDPRESLAPFLVVYDASGNPLASSATLNDRTPVPPSGVFDYVRTHGEDSVTWQPNQNVRIATVIERYDSGFVLAGRSMREIEKRESWLELQVGLAWLASLFVLALLFISHLIWP